MNEGVSNGSLLETQDEEYAGAGGLNRCFGYDTREEAVEDYLKYRLKK